MVFFANASKRDLVRYRQELQGWKKQELQYLRDCLIKKCRETMTDEQFDLTIHLCAVNLTLDRK